MIINTSVNMSRSMNVSTSGIASRNDSDRGTRAETAVEARVGEEAIKKRKGAGSVCMYLTLRTCG